MAFASSLLASQKIIKSQDHKKVDIPVSRDHKKHYERLRKHHHNLTRGSPPSRNSGSSNRPSSASSPTSTSCPTFFRRVNVCTCPPPPPSLRHTGMVLLPSTPPSPSPTIYPPLHAHSPALRVPPPPFPVSLVVARLPHTGCLVLLRRIGIGYVLSRRERRLLPMPERLLLLLGRDGEHLEVDNVLPPEDNLLVDPRVRGHILTPAPPAFV